MLCALDELAAEAPREVTLAADSSAPFPVLLLRRGDRVLAYMNRCPHQKRRLNERSAAFLYEDGTLRCSNHVSHFRIDDGHCVTGLCEGDSLYAVPVEIRDGQVVVAP